MTLLIFLQIADWNGTSGSATKVVIMTSCLLSDVHRYTLRCLAAQPSIQWCYIFTSISEVCVDCSTSNQLPIFLLESRVYSLGINSIKIHVDTW